MRIAVTGANGFVGRHVLAHLQSLGVETTAVVRNRRNAADLPCEKVVEVDVHSPLSNTYQQIGGPDVLIHLAWGGLPNYRANSHFETELPTHYEFLKSLIHSGLPRLTVAGTCLEYGMRNGCLEEADITSPTTPYGFAKDCLRRQLEYLQASFHFELTWARLFYVFGAGQSNASLYSQLLAAQSRGICQFEMSGGEQLRDYMPIGDAARALVALAMNPTGANIVNVCSGNPISVRRLVENWIRENAWSITPKFGSLPYPNYEPMAFWGSRRKLDSLGMPSGC